MIAAPTHSTKTINSKQPTTMSFEEELLQDAQDDALAVQYIRTHIPQELQELYSEELLYYFIDLIIEYYAESGILESAADKEGYIEIDEEAIANYIAQKAKKEGMGDFNPEDLLFVVQAQMDFEESLAE